MKSSPRLPQLEKARMQQQRPNEAKDKIKFKKKMKCNKCFLMEGNENVLKLTVVKASQLCEYTKNHWTVYFWMGELYGMQVISQ